MKTISTTVKTGDKFQSGGLIYTVGQWRKIDGKGLIDLKVFRSETSCITIQVSTRELNKILSQSTIIN